MWMNIKISQYWDINYQLSDSGNNAFFYIKTDMSIKLDDDDFCEKFAKIETAIADMFLIFYFFFYIYQCSLLI